MKGMIRRNYLQLKRRQDNIKCLQWMRLRRMTLLNTFCIPESGKKNHHMRNVANRALNIAQQLGASYVDVRVMERTTEGIEVKNGRVEGVASGTSSGFNVRVIVDGALGFASSARMDDAEADRVAKQAIQIARASALVAGEPVRLSPLAPQHGFYRTPMQKD